jgi:hypothetical protein
MMWYILRKTRRDWLGTLLPLIFVSLSPCNHTECDRKSYGVVREWASISMYLGRFLEKDWLRYAPI